MISRIRFVITAVLLCHLLGFVQLVTCEAPEDTGQKKQAAPRFLPAEEVTIRAREQSKEKAVYHLRGDVEINFRNYLLRAEEVTYDSESGDVQATGGVVFDGGPHNTHIEAHSGTYNVNTENGTFYDVVGSVGTRFRGKNVVLTTMNPFLFTGREVRKVGRDRYIVLHGTVTSCALPRPKWTFNAAKVDVIAGEDAKIYHSSFRILRVPIFYFPFASHPVDTLGRTSGFLLPTVGQSSRKGFTLGESVYWAMNRSADITLGAEYYSIRGWSQTAEFRSRPSQFSHLNFRYNGMIDRGDPNTHVDQGGEEAHLDAELALPHDIHGVANVNYLSAYIYRLAFSSTFSQAVNSEVASTAFFTKAKNGFSMNVMSSRYQNFQSTVRGDQILLVHAPTFEISTADRRIFGSPLLWGLDATSEGLSRREPNFVTANLVGRFDVRPSLALPFTWQGWSIRPEIALRNTYYSQRQVPTTGVGIPIDDALNRRALETDVELRPPALARIFDREVFGRKIKHTIEPRIAYHYTTGVDRFQNVIRFDARDILSNTNEVEAGFTQRLFAKRHIAHTDPRCEIESGATREPQQVAGEFLPGTSAEPLRCEQEGEQTREVLSWEIKQKYFLDPTFGGAVINGRRNVLTTTAEFAGIAFLTEPRNWSPIVSRLRVLTSANTDIQWELDYDTKKGRINSSTAFVNYRIGEVFIGGSQALLHAPGEVVTSTPANVATIPAPDIFNQFRVLLGYGHPGKLGLSAGASAGFDAVSKFMQYGAVQTSYNWDCCGLSVEFRRFALGSVRNENQFRFAFTLANVGTFGNLRRQERLF